MQLQLTIRRSNGRSLQKAVDWQDNTPVPERGEKYLIKDLGVEVPVHGVKGMSEQRPELIFTRNLEVPDIHRLQSLGWKLASN